MKLLNTTIAAGMLLGALATPALARADVAVVIGVPPPAPMIEVMPVPQPGYVWVPGYWAWHRDRHIWLRGHWVLARPGYVWMPERWVQSGPQWQLHRGYWERPRHGRGHAYGHDRQERRWRRD